MVIFAPGEQAAVAGVGFLGWFEDFYFIFDNSGYACRYFAVAAELGRHTLYFTSKVRFLGLD